MEQRKQGLCIFVSPGFIFKRKSHRKHLTDEEEDWRSLSRKACKGVRLPEWELLKGAKKRVRKIEIIQMFKKTLTEVFKKRRFDILRAFLRSSAVVVY